jgi:UDP-N-acetylmuramoyl-L-alanyl-D-glutamate--2,6-diaminopimelate ligase
MSRTMRLVELVPGAPDDIVVSGLTADSRAVRPGDAFFALGGFGTHGLRFAEQARAAGAAAVLFEPPAPEDVPAVGDAIAVPGLRARMGAMGDRFHGRPSHAMTMVGVTGTSGKTSTVQLLAQALQLMGVDSGTVGTLGAGRHGAAVATGYTTPMVLEMHALLARLRDEGVQAVAMEVSSHALDQGRVDAVHYDVAVFTNLTRDHLDYHGDMDSYGAAKAKLFVREGLRAAVINIDDGFGRHLIGSLPPGVHAIGTSSRGGQADVRAGNLVLGGDGLQFDLVLGDDRRSVRSPLLGRFNVDNLLAVAGALHALGHGIDAIAAVLPRLTPIPGRMNRLGGGNRPLVVVDYSHKPDALQQALDSLRGHLEGRLVCVFGCGGERDAGKRPQMAAIAERAADLVIVTDDNPRREDGDAIVAAIMAGFSEPGRVLVERDRRRAIERAIGSAGPGDIVLVAGKGHETYQDVAGTRHPFDDRAVARDALDAWQPEARA